MKNSLLITLLLLCPIIFGQNNFFSRKEIPVLHTEVHTQFLIYKNDNVFQVSYLYKIPYSRIQFEKVDDHFESQFEMTIEVKNKNHNVVKREFVKDRIITYSFDETISNKKYLENFITFTLSPDTYTFQIIFEDKLTNRQRPQKPVSIVLNDTTEKYSPILVENKLSENKYVTANFSGQIPFSKELYSLIIFSDKIESEKKYLIRLYQSDSLYFQTEARAQKFRLPEFRKQDEFISVSFDSLSILNGILLSEINKNLEEGLYQLKTYSDDGVEIYSTKISVKWFNKPFSLNDADFALEMISYIEPENSYNNLLKSSLSSEELLKQYWKTKDPTPATSFNELMEVFYERVDYAEFNFRNLSGVSGAKTDRGKIYITNGNPDRIERGVNSDGKITESWYYGSPKRAFVFVDKRGDGSFKLEQ
ncbi:GWxTD domain-containing protein [Ignavibacterium sp.]|uniref:GWxTD domain-containing protein n=1 Tax=Ignavibacterium sp. TaxID=2651167 RepID=UPI00307E9969